MRADHQIEASFIPLTDSAPLIVAHELGFAEKNGVRISLSRERSWATVRDRLSVAQIDIAHALAPMPLASNLGLDPIPKRLIAPMALGFGGNTVTVSKPLWSQVRTHQTEPSLDAGRAITSLARVAAERRTNRAGPLRFGIVHPHSAHRYELAYWLAAKGIMPARDVEFVVLPPSLMAAALANNRIDGFCAGEPWGSIAVDDGVGEIVTTKAHIWRSSPEKVLVARGTWAEKNPELVKALIRALFNAAEWCDQPENRETLADLLAQRSYLNRPARIILRGLNRTVPTGDATTEYVESFLNFSGNAATFPWISHALWLYTQMVRWGDVAPSRQSERTVRSTYRPDLYRSALSSLNVPIPSASAKVEGALVSRIHVGSTSGELTLGPDGFFDGMCFDPEDTQAYIETQKARDHAFLRNEIGKI